MTGLYLHIPYCVAKCHYCDFNSRPPLQGERFDPYVQAICMDLERHAGAMAVPVETIFFGGGTPSLLSTAQLRHIMEAVRQFYRLAPDCEITLEANPGTIDGPSQMVSPPSRPGGRGSDGYDGLFDMGINRLSFGVQSTHAALLDRLGRKHSWEEAQKAFRSARRAGFKHINLDLMYGLPDQTVEQWDTTLRDCIELGPDHLSTYSLIVENGTTFGTLHAAGRLTLPSEEDEEAMSECTRDRCESAGYVAYEVSNWARPGQECRHNLLYWRNGDYLGVGAGAVSGLSGWRYTRVRQPAVYIERSLSGDSLVESAERVDPVTSWHDSMSLGLRCFAGVDLHCMESRYDLVPGSLQSGLSHLFAAEAERNLVSFDSGRMRLTWDGMRVANHFMVRIMETWPTAVSHSEAPEVALRETNPLLQ